MKNEQLKYLAKSIQTSTELVSWQVKPENDCADAVMLNVHNQSLNEKVNLYVKVSNDEELTLFEKACLSGIVQGMKSIEKEMSL